jgi:hypothetical protein
VTKLVLVVIIVFSVCWAPIQFVLLFKAVGIYTTKGTEDFKNIVFQILSHVLAYVNRYVQSWQNIKKLDLLFFSLIWLLLRL